MGTSTTEEEGMRTTLRTMVIAAASLASATLLSPGWTSLLSTAGGLVFGGTEEGNFIALDAESGKPLWDLQLGGTVRGIPISYGVDGKQYVAIAAGNALFAFSLP